MSQDLNVSTKVQANKVDYSPWPVSPGELKNEAPQTTGDNYSSFPDNPSLRTFSESMAVGQPQLLARGDSQNTIDSDLSQFMDMVFTFKTFQEAGNALDKQIVSEYKQTAISREILGFPLEIVSKTGKLSSRDQETLSKTEKFIAKYPGLQTTMKGIKTKVSLLLSTRDITAPFDAFSIGLDSSRDALMITSGNEDSIFNELNEIYDRQSMSKALSSSFPGGKKYDALSTAMDTLYLDKTNDHISSNDIKALFLDYEKYVKDRIFYIPKSPPISETFKEEIKSLLINRVQRYCGSNHTKKEIESAIDFNKMFGIIDKAGLESEY